MNTVKCYITQADISDILVHLKGYCDALNPYDVPVLIEVTVRKLSWEDFNRRLNEWKFHEGFACTVVSKDEIYISEVVLSYDTYRVRELECSPATEIMEYSYTDEDECFGLPRVVFCHLIGQIKTDLSPTR
jgi:hypothetical protein